MRISNLCELPEALLVENKRLKLNSNYILQRRKFISKLKVLEAIEHQLIESDPKVKSPTDKIENK